MSRKNSPGEFKAVGPAASTNPAPEDPVGSLSAELGELRSALEVVGGLCSSVLKKLSETRLAQLVSEHKHNVARAKRIADRRAIVAQERLLGDHDRRVREVEKFLPLLEELERNRGTAAE